MSVIVCFRNEADRLANYLPLILQQDYPDFEVLAVDDHSRDGSARTVARLQEVHPNLRLLRPPTPTRPGKKDALTFGIQAARHDILLLTDADCAPASDQWIRLMTAPLSAGTQDPSLKAPHSSPNTQNQKLNTQNSPTDLVLGFSPYREVAGPVNAFQRFETTYTAFQYLGFAHLGSPYMGVGRNMAYRKGFFLAAGGLEQHAHLAGGDDDLLVSHHANAARTAVCVTPAAWTISDPATSFWDYLIRKYRHVGVGIAYPAAPAFKIALLALSHVLIYGITFYALLYQWHLLEILPLFFLRWLIVAETYLRHDENSLLKATPNSAGRLSAIPSILWHDFLLNFYYLLTAPALLLGGRGKGGWT